MTKWFLIFIGASGRPERCRLRSCGEACKAVCRARPAGGFAPIASYVSAFTYQDTFGYIGAFSSASFNRNIVSVGVQDPVLDEFVVEPEHGGFRYILLNIGGLDFMTAGVTQRYDEMMTESGIEHEFYLTNGGHDFSTWSDGLHTFVLNIFGAGDSAD